MLKLNAQLSQLLSRAPSSPYWRFAEISLLTSAQEQQLSVKEYVESECFKAYSLDKLPNSIRDFLLLCDRSIAIRYELFEGMTSGLSLREEDEKVIDAMVERGDLEDAS